MSFYTVGGSIRPLGLSARVKVERREERRLIACLFIDVVGSTELTQRLGPERLKAALGAVFAELVTLIEREGGTVEKYIGDAIYALFGAPVAHADDPARAVRAADAVRRWHRARTAGDISLEVRAGIEVGEAVVDLAAVQATRQQMSVGAVVNVAARLQAHADPGDVLVGPVAHRATEDIAQYDDLGETDLKGVGRTRVWKLVALRGEATRERLPFVGRQSELELLRIAQRRASSRSVLALVTGPPGQGKTRLVEEFVASLPRARVLKGRSRPGGEIASLSPLRELLIGDQPSSELDRVVAAATGDPAERVRITDALAHSAGIAVSEALASLGKDERDDETQNAWRRFIRGLGSLGPVVLWIEDVHWAAPDVVRVLDRLSLSGEPMLMILTARPEFAEAAGLRPSGDRFFVELEGLESQAALALADSAGGSSNEVLARAEGNPLFIVELVRGQVSSTDLPLTLQGALGARLDELSPDDRALLGHAAVIGESFTAHDAAALAGLEGAGTASALSRLVDLHYLDAVDGRYRFHHSLLRDVAYGRLLVAERMRLHARYTREVVRSEEPEVRAHHWWAAVGGPDAEWVWRDDPDRVVLQHEAFRAQLEAGLRAAKLFAIDRAVDLFERARALARDDRELAEATHGLADAYALDLRADEAWKAYRETTERYRAVGAVPADVYLGALKIRMRLGAFQRVPPPEEVAALQAEAEAAARASGDAAVLARTLVYSAFADMDPASARGDRVRIMEAVRLAEKTDTATRYEILGWYAEDLLRTYELRQAARMLDQIEQLGVDTSELDRMEHLRGRAVLEFLAGDLDRLKTVSSQLVAMSRRMGPHLRSHADVYAAHAAFATADWGGVVRIGEEMAQLMRSSPQTAFCASAATVFALAAATHARAGRPDDARALADLIAATKAQIQGVGDLHSLALVFTGAAVDSDRLNGPFGAVTAVAARAHDRALAIAADLESRARGGARLYGALAQGVREEVAHDRGGPLPAHRALHDIGYVGWAELLRARG